MANICVICTEQLPEAMTTLKCGHRFCSECIMNNIARNTGTEEGTSRNKCPMCRDVCCQEVLPSVNITIHMGDLKDEIDGLREDLQDRQEDLVHLASDLKFSDTNNVFYKKKCTELEAKLEITYTDMIKFRDDAIRSQFMATQRGTTIKRQRAGIKRVGDILSDYRERHTDSALDMLQTTIRSIRYRSLPLPTCEPDVPSAPDMCNIFQPIQGGMGGYDPGDSEDVTTEDYLLSAAALADDVVEISARSDILTVHSPASHFFRLAEILNMRIPFGLESYLPIEQSHLPANETRILKTIANHLNGIDKAVGIYLAGWPAADILTINPCGGDYLILKASALDSIIGSKIGELLSMFGLVKKYSNESVSSQRTRLKKVLDLRDEPRRALVGRWIDEKIPDLLRLDVGFI